MNLLDKLEFNKNHHIIKIFWPKEELWQLYVNGNHTGVYTVSDLLKQSGDPFHILDNIAYHTANRDCMNQGIGVEYEIPKILNTGNL